MHTNSVDDPHYKNFLRKIINPVINNVKDKAIGLDFGCGPGPILKEMFKPFNIMIEEYDLFYKDDKTLLEKNWDFIVSTEVVEHLKHPEVVLNKLWSKIAQNGCLAIMTSLYSKDISFQSWYYKGDPTHIIFYTKESFIYLGEKLNAQVEFFNKNIIILKKN